MEPVEKVSTKKRKDNVSVSNVMDNIMEPVDENVSTKRTRNEELRRMIQWIRNRWRMDQ